MAELVEDLSFLGVAENDLTKLNSVNAFSVFAKDCVTECLPDLRLIVKILVKLHVSIKPIVSYIEMHLPLSIFCPNQ